VRERAVRVLLILAAVAPALVACHSGPPPGSEPAAFSSPTAASGAPAKTSEGVQPVGATTPRGAVEAFLAAARAQDVQAMSAVWGSAQGPAREYIPHDVVEKRLLIMLCFLRHDKSAIGDPAAGIGGRVTFAVTLSQGSLTRSTTVTTVIGPQARYYVETFDMKAVEPLCQNQVKPPPPPQ
jgi:hypothetical protein